MSVISGYFVLNFSIFKGREKCKGEQLSREYILIKAHSFFSNMIDNGSQTSSFIDNSKKTLIVSYNVIINCFNRC